MMQETLKPLRKQPLPWREIDGRAVLVNPRANEVHELNPVGTFLWLHADGTRSIRELGAALSEAFEVEPEQAVADASEFFTHLARSGLIENP